jgi:hypothetical protein
VTSANVLLEGIKRWFGNGFKTKEEVEQEEIEKYNEYNEALRVMGRKPIERPKKDEEKD